MSRLIRINPRDNVAVALEPLKSGESALGVTLREVELKDANSIEEATHSGGQLGAYPQCQDQSFRPAGIQLPSASLRHAR